jgi:hypothetical protein
MARESKMKLPDKDFIAYASTINSQCTEHSTEWGLDAARLSTLSTLTVNANTAYEANSDKAKRNLITSTNKKTAFGELKHFLPLFIDYLEGNLTVPDEALEVMGLRPRTHHVHEPLPRPAEAPVLAVIKQHDEMTAYVSRAELGHPTQSEKRKGYHGFKLRWRFEDETAFHIELSTRLHYTVHFDRADETKRVIMSAAWINPRLEEGPWSDDITEIVG